MNSNSKKLFLKLSQLTAISISLLILVDLVCYIVIPSNLTRMFFFYRKNLTTPHAARRSPPGLFEAHSLRGLDLAPSKYNLKHEVEGLSISVFTNELGCFDDLSIKDLGGLKRFDYFAGDSFTWGFLPFEKNFPSLFEHLSKRKALKCGVSHTGQLHQFSKFKEITKKINRYPENVFVGYFVNDPANDHAYPHSTVVNNYDVDTVGVKANDVDLIQRDLKLIQSQIEDWEKKTISSQFHNWLRGHSIWFNLYLHFTQTRSFYRLQFSYNHQNNYIKNPLTKKNREALINWAKDSVDNKYKLTLILIPDKFQPLKPNPYADFEVFLKAHKISYINLAIEMLKRSTPHRQLYWKKDSHFNELGAEFVAKILSESILKDQIK